MTATKYIVESSFCGWNVVHPDRDKAAEFLQSDEAREACERLNDGDDRDGEYEWHNWSAEHGTT